MQVNESMIRNTATSSADVKQIVDLYMAHDAQHFRTRMSREACPHAWRHALTCTMGPCKRDGSAPGSQVEVLSSLSRSQHESGRHTHGAVWAPSRPAGLGGTPRFVACMYSQDDAAIPVPSGIKQEATKNAMWVVTS